MFLNGTIWSDWDQTALKADASARSYTRLSGPNSSSVVLADVPPETEDYAIFLNIADRLTACGLCVPQMLAADHRSGFFVISDLGVVTLFSHLADNPKDQPIVSDAIVSLLNRLRGIEIPNLTAMTPTVAAEMLGPLFDNYDDRGRGPVSASLLSAFERTFDGQLVLSLRDFHAENLIWRRDQTGLNRLGILDFQDAFLAPDGYDLASFTRDARRLVPLKERQSMERQFAKRCNVPIEIVGRNVSLLAVQRNLRILGIFAGLSARGATKYQAFMPTVWSYIVDDLQHPKLTGLAEAVLEHVAPVGVPR